MRILIAVLFVAAAPAWAWDFTPDPICTLSWEDAGSRVVVTYDPRIPEYAITLRRAVPWPDAPEFAIRFDGARAMIISTTRHARSEGGTALTVTDRGFGNVLDGLEFYRTATALTGAAALAVPLDGAAPKVAAFRACAAAPAV
jgi:hypothetical protein